MKPTMVVYIGKGRRNEKRLGITVSKKIGCAVVRNKAKRRVRQLFCGEYARLKASIDICVVVRTRLIDCDYAKLEADFVSALQELDAYV